MTLPPQPDQYTLDIFFRGICSHFHHDILPAIPHRVVLPEASMLVPGLLTGPDSIVSEPNNPADWLHYVLSPHFPYVAMVNADALNTRIAPLLSAYAVIADGEIFTSTGLTIANAIDTVVTYPPTSSTPLAPGELPFTALPALTDYVSNYAYSRDVVLGGRAAAYFDIYGGEITAYSQGTQLGARVRVTTSGPPKLRVSPLAVKDLPQDVQIVDLTTDPNQLHATMVVGNSGLGCDSGNFDFIMHYLTSASGIPRAVTRALPGMNGPECTVEKILEGLAKLAHGGAFAGFGANTDDLVMMTDQASCSDSRYP